MKNASNHCYNYIKQCPFCGVVWFKVSGCDGETTCGNFPDADSLEFQSQTIPQRFKFKFAENALEFEDLGRNYVLYNSPLFSKYFYMLIDKDEDFLSNDMGKFDFFKLLMEQKRYLDPGSKRIGCGKSIVWSEIPPLEPHIVKELFDPGVLDYFAEEVQKTDL